MTQEERRQYAREYRAEGFGREVDRRYYQRNAEMLRAKSRERYLRKKCGKLSQEHTTTP